MISDKRFATSFFSFWRDLMPLSVKSLQNLEHERFDTPLASQAAPKSPVEETRPGEDQRQVDFSVKYASLQLFSASVKGKLQLTSKRLPVKAVREICHNDEFNRIECAQAVEIARRLTTFFRRLKPKRRLVVHPQFPGCGFLAATEGDILSGETLFVVSVGQKPIFSIDDLRLLIVHAALNNWAGKFEVTQLGLLNPRLGVFLTLPIDRLIPTVSGKHSSELFAELSDFITSAGVSQ
jgi:hypothetical protein